MAIKFVAPSNADAVSDPKTIRHYFMLVFTGYLGLILISPKSGLGLLPLRFLLKNQLHVTAKDMALFLAVGTFALYLKPLAGIFTDSILLFGTRHRHYFLFSAAGIAILWLVLGLVPKTYPALLCATIALTLCWTVAQTTLGGLAVEIGKEHGIPGRLASLREGAAALTILVRGPVGGFLATQAFILCAFVNGALTALLALLFFFWLQEAPGDQNYEGAWNSVREQFGLLFQSRTMWVATGLYCLVCFNPASHTPLFYYQSEKLKFTPEFIGKLGVINGALDLTGAILYAFACKRLRLQTLLTIGICINTLSALLYLAYRSHNSAMVLEGAEGLGFGLATLPLLDLLARATPKYCEAFGYALMFSLGYASVALSDVVGSWVFDHYHHNFSLLIWLNAGTTALVFLAVPFLPRAVIRWRDGESMPD